MIARVIIAPLDKRVAKINNILSTNELTPNHPDLLYLPNDSKLGIAEARKIKEHFSFKPYSAKGRAVVLEDASALTDEAQNALLKTLEELPEQALFVLGASSDAQLLPTVLSRCEIITLQPGRTSTVSSVEPLQAKSDKSAFLEEIEKLLGSTTEERFEYIAKLKDREAFFHFLIRYFHQQLVDSTHERLNLVRLNQFVKELLQAEQWQKQNVAIRGILEYLMLSMPQKSW